MMTCLYGKRFLLSHLEREEISSIFNKQRATYNNLYRFCTLFNESEGQLFLKQLYGHICTQSEAKV